MNKKDVEIVMQKLIQECGDIFNSFIFLPNAEQKKDAEDEAKQQDFIRGLVKSIRDNPPPPENIIRLRRK